MISEYYLKARLFPTVLTIIPLILLYVKFIAPILAPELSVVWDYLPLLAGISINTAIIFLFVMINRFLSKVIFQQILYQNDLKMPTTDYLLPGNPIIDEQTRERYYDIIQHDLGYDIRSALQSLSSEHEKRLYITRIVGEIRPKLKDNKMVIQHNYEYGFTRNLVGGSFLATIISIGLSIYSFIIQDTSILYTSVIMAIVYAIPVIASKWFIKYHGNNYASVLFEQYCTLNH